MGRFVVLASMLLLAGCATFGPRPPYAGTTPTAEAYGHYLESIMHQRAGELEQAAEAMEEAARVAPEELRLRVELIRLYRQLGEADKAKKACRGALEIAPDSPSLWMILGWLNQQTGDYDKAVAAYAEAVALRPEDKMGYSALIMAAEEANDIAAALDIYRKLIELAPDSPVFHFRLAYQLSRISRYEDALPHVKAALELNPDYAKALHLQGLIYFNLGQNAEAAGTLRKYIELAPTDLGALRTLAGAYARQGDFGAALPCLDKILASGEATPRHLVERAYLLLRLGRSREATAMTPPNSAPILGSILNAMARKQAGGRYRDELATLDDVEGDVDAEARDLVTDVLFLMGSEEAGEYFLHEWDAFREETIPSKHLELFRARICYDLKRYEEAELILLDALDLFGPDKWLHYYLATVYESLDNFLETEKHLKAALALDPQDPEIMNFLGYLYAEQGIHLDTAETLLKAALETNPENGFYLDSLGWVYYKQGDAGQAIRYIRHAIFSMEADDAVLRDHLGDAYLLNGELDKALNEWRKALVLDPGMDSVQEKIEEHGQ